MIRPIGNKVLILKEKLPEKIGSIYLVTPSDNNSSTPPHVGVIVSMGSKCTNQFTLGMRVSYHWSEGLDIQHDDIDYILVPENKISGIIALNVVLS